MTDDDFLTEDEWSEAAQHLAEMEDQAAYEDEQKAKESGK